MTDYTQPQQDFNQPQVALPNATAVLILGIIGIVTCCCWGIGAVLAVIALVLAAKDIKLYKANPYMYTKSSLNNLNAGRICAIIGLVFSLLCIAYYLYIGSIIGWENMQDPEALQQAMEKLQNGSE